MSDVQAESQEPMPSDAAPSSTEPAAPVAVPEPAPVAVPEPAAAVDEAEVKVPPVEPAKGIDPI